MHQLPQTTLSCIRVSYQGQPPQSCEVEGRFASSKDTGKLIKINDSFRQQLERRASVAKVIANKFFPSCWSKVDKSASASSTRPDAEGAPVHNPELSLLSQQSLLSLYSETTQPRLRGRRDDTLPTGCVTFTVTSP